MACPRLEFCPVCDNMFYLREQGGALEQFCRRCTYSRRLAAGAGEREICVFEKRYGGAARADLGAGFEAGFEDPAVPVTRDVLCPNDACPSNAEGGSPLARSVVVDRRSLRILYRCEFCRTSWTN